RPATLLPYTTLFRSHELRVLQFFDRRGAAIAHRLADAADELVQDRGDRPLVRHAPLDALGHELLDVLDVALEVTIARRAASAHRTERAHSPVLLEALALVEDDISGALVGACE